MWTLEGLHAKPHEVNCSLSDTWRRWREPVSLEIFRFRMVKPLQPVQIKRIMKTDQTTIITLNDKNSSNKTNYCLNNKNYNKIYQNT